VFTNSRQSNISGKIVNEAVVFPAPLQPRYDIEIFTHNLKIRLYNFWLLISVYISICKITFFIEN